MRTVPSKIQYNIRTLSSPTRECQCDGVVSAEDCYGHNCRRYWLLLMMQDNSAPSINCLLLEER
jgi:hypothetical protein